LAGRRWNIGQPQTTPICDVNVWRAWGHIEGWISPKHYRQVPTTLKDYLDYRQWFNGLASAHGLAPRELDRALMAFGQFLSSRWGALL
jgi:hypothetical protein